MIFKVDENLPKEVASLLEESGHEASTTLDEEMQGSSDDILADQCRNEGKAIVTLDLGFADIRAYPPNQYAGLIVLRLRRQDKPHVLRVFQGLLENLAIEELVGHLWIVEENRVRVRG